MTPEFVAEARRVYVPAAKWARANGAKFRRVKWSGFSDSRWIKDESCVIWNRYWLTYYEDSLNKRFEVRPTCVQQALDYLVTAEVLPAEFSNIHAGYVEAVDYDGEYVLLAPTDDGTGVVQFWDVDVEGEPPSHYKPLFRRVTETAGSVTT